MVAKGAILIVKRQVAYRRRVYLTTIIHKWITNTRQSIHSNEKYLRVHRTASLFVLRMTAGGTFRMVPKKKDKNTIHVLVSYHLNQTASTNTNL